MFPANFGPGRSGILRPDEVRIDEDALRDIMHMYRNSAAIKTSREAFLSMTLCGPFSFSIPKLGLHSSADMSKLVNRHWMPWLRSVYDYIKTIGVCPYYFVRPKGNRDHQVPVVPDIEMGYITVSITKDHKLDYTWYWSHGFQQSAEKSMLWIHTDHAPTRHGEIRSACASLLTQYRTILVLQKSLEIASTQCARPSHILEYHPSAASAKNDDLTQLVANFGERAAGMSKGRQEAARANEIRVRTNELMKQNKRVAEANAATGLSTQTRLMYTDTTADQLERMDAGFAGRTLPLRPDFKYVAATRPTVVAELDKHLTSFNLIAAAVMDFALELIQPTGSARTQNVQGSERFENERIKEALNFFTMVTQSALVIAYRPQFEQGFKAAKEWRINKRGGDASEVAEMHAELDVQVDMSCTPMLNYSDLKDMWLDGIMTKETFAHHAFHLRSMPHDQIEISMYPDMVPRDADGNVQLPGMPSKSNSSNKPAAKKKQKTNA